MDSPFLVDSIDSSAVCGQLQFFRSGKELSLAKNAGYGSIKNVTLHLSSKITLQVFAKPCQNKLHNNLDNAWVEFPFYDDFLGGQRNCFF